MERTNVASEEPLAEAAQTSAPAPSENYLDQLMRLKAEFENYRKRTDREKPEFYRRGKAEVVFKLIPLFDLLQQAHAEIQRSHVDTPLAKGMEGIFKEFEKLFKEEGVAVMLPVGKPYDAQQQEVIGTVERPGVADGIVVEVLQNGFTLQDKVLRTAKVRIASSTQTQKGENI